MRRVLANGTITQSVVVFFIYSYLLGRNMISRDRFYIVAYHVCLPGDYSCLATAATERTGGQFFAR